MSINGVRTGVPLYAVNSDQVQLANGSVGLPSFRFKNAPATGLYLQGLSNVAISCGGVQSALFTPTIQTLTGEVVTGIVACNSITTGNITCSQVDTDDVNGTNGNLDTLIVNTTLRIPTGAVNGYLLQSDGTGQVSWIAPPAVPTANTILAPPVYSSTLAVSGLGSITACSYFNYQISDGTTKVVHSTGSFTFNGSVAEGNSGYVEIPISNIISSFTVATTQGFIVRNTPGASGTFALSVESQNTVIRITLTNSTSAPWISSTTFHFNLISSNQQP